MKPYWRDEKRDLTIYHARCEDLFIEWGADHFGSVIADSPYGVTKEPWDVPPTKEVIRECLRVAEGTVVMFGSARMESLVHFVALRPDRALCWVPAWTRRMSRDNGLTYEWDPVWAWRLPERQDVLHSDRLTQHLKPSRGFRSPWHHSCFKPESLMRDLVAAFGGRSVLDCYMGSGTTLVAAAKLGIPATGIDCGEKYCAMAAARLSDDVTYGDEPTLFNREETKP